MPKIDLHRHLEGAVRLTTLVEIAQEYGIEMPEYDIETLRPFVQVMPGEVRNPQHFLGKFGMLRQFFRSPAVIQRVTWEAVADAALEGVKYLELRFTPAALANILKCPYSEVIGWVNEAASAAAAAHDIVVRLIVSMNRHESISIGEKVLAAAAEFIGTGVVALDLAGNEAQYPSHPFYDLFDQIKAAGFYITIHAGEWAGADGVWEAVERLHADRIGHGVRAIEDPAVIALLAARGIPLEICPSSNVASGVVADWPNHPLPQLFRQGVKTTLNTDDPLVCDITQGDELVRVAQHFGFSLTDIKQHTMNAANAAFLPPDERAALTARFSGWLNGF
jgi:adenosine deaminase